MSSFLPKFLPPNFISLFLIAQIGTIDHDESIGDAQRKKALGYRLQFDEKLEICKLQIWSSFFLTLLEREHGNRKKNFLYRNRKRERQKVVPTGHYHWGPQERPERRSFRPIFGKFGSFCSII